MRRKLLAIIAVVAAVLLGAADGWIIAGGKTANAQTDLPAPPNVQVSKGDAAGEVVVSWDAVPGASYYSIRWLNFGSAQILHETGGIGKTPFGLWTSW